MPIESEPPPEAGRTVAGGRDLSRRDFLKVAAGVTAAVAVGGCRADPRVRAERVTALTDPLYNSSAKALAGAIRDKRISSVELVDIYLDRIDQVNPSLNAVVQLRAEGARADARRADESLARGDSLGPLHGLPMTIKDSFDTEGVITSWGTLGRAGFVPDRDATVVRRLRDAGAILLGKTKYRGVHVRL